MEKVSKEKITELISRIKIVRVEKGMSFQQIVDRTEEMGAAVSMSTVKRVFNDADPKVKWSTLRLIANAVLGVGFDTPVPDETDPEQPKLYYSEIEALKVMIESKGEMIAVKDRSIAFLQAQLRRQQTAATVLGISTAVFGIAFIVSLLLLT